MIPTSRQVVSYLEEKYGDGEWHVLEQRSRNIYKEVADRFCTTVEEMAVRDAGGVQKKFQHSVRNGLDRLRTKGLLVLEGNPRIEDCRFRIVPKSEAVPKLLPHRLRKRQAIRVLGTALANLIFYEPGGPNDYGVTVDRKLDNAGIDLEALTGALDSLGLDHISDCLLADSALAYSAEVSEILAEVSET